MLQHKIMLVRQLCLSERATLNGSRFHLSRSSRLDSSSRDIGPNSAELADVVALQGIEFLRVSNQYTSLEEERTCGVPEFSPAGGRTEKQTLGLFLCLLLWLMFSSSGTV